MELAIDICISFAGAGASGLATWSVIVISKELPPMTTALSLLTVPICGIIASSIVLHESITLINIVAMSLIITGLAFIIIDSFRNTSEQI